MNLQERPPCAYNGSQRTVGYREMKRLTTWLKREDNWSRKLGRSPSEGKTIIKTLVARKWMQEHPTHNKSDSYYSLSRPEQVILFRLRTGHNRLNAHLYNMLKVGQTEMCPCSTAPQNTEHLLQECPRQAALRREVWPRPLPLKEKLYGNLGALQRTALFVMSSNVAI